MNDVRALTTTELQQGLDRDSGLHVLNVQTDRSFGGELIPGSRRVPLDTIGASTPGLAKDAEIVTYCGGPACSQSIEAAKKLTGAGAPNDLGRSGQRAECRREHHGTNLPAAPCAVKGHSWRDCLPRGRQNGLTRAGRPSPAGRGRAHLPPTGAGGSRRPSGR